ncbi:MAG: GNAT family N-acetyltransferase [Chitinophagaceae bacterium]|nr:GNAT family N-acetyltransferase [Chitinophagaceae bacterium]
MHFQVSRLTYSDSYFIEQLVEDFLSEEEKPTVDHLKSVLSDDRTYLYIAAVNEKVIGYCLVYRFPSIYSSHHLAYLYDIEVIEEHQKKGIGREFIRVAKEQLAKDNVSELWPGTATDNESGQTLFSRTGAVKSDETFNDYTYEL